MQFFIKTHWSKLKKDQREKTFFYCKKFTKKQGFEILFNFFFQQFFKWAYVKPNFEQKIETFKSNVFC